RMRRTDHLPRTVRPPAARPRRPPGLSPGNEDKRWRRSGARSFTGAARTPAGRRDQTLELFSLTDAACERRTCEVQAAASQTPLGPPDPDIRRGVPLAACAPGPPVRAGVGRRPLARPAGWLGRVLSLSRGPCYAHPPPPPSGRPLSPRRPPPAAHHPPP